MDENKDVQKTDSISKFIDSQNVRLNPFGDNKTGERAYRRAERIITALHLLTNHIPAMESARVSIRTESIRLLPLLLELRDEMRAAHSQGIIAIQSSLRHIVSLLRILTVSGFISTQNANTMVEALDDLGSFLTASQRSPLSESVSLSRDEFIDARANYAPVQSSVRLIKDAQVTTIKDTVSIQRTVDANSSETAKTSVRTQSIMDILRSGGSLGIKEICANLPEYSEKTVQRELFKLVGAGFIKKNGFKRWSKYSVT